MRRAAVLKTLCGLAILGLALAVYACPALFAGAHRQAGFAAVIGAVLASGLAAKLVVPAPLFGAHVQFSAPLGILVVAPYVLRFVLLDPDSPLARLWGRRPEAAAPPPAAASPYALPARVAVALAAAARARR